MEIESNLLLVFQRIVFHFCRCRPIGHQVIGTRLSRLDNHFRGLLTNHNNDPTGAEGEDVPVWFDVVKRLKIFQESQSARGRAQASRANSRDVQATLGAVQPPLGVGDPPLHSETATENDPQVPGHLMLGAGMELNVMSQQQPNLDEPQEEVENSSQQTQRRCNRTSTGATRRNRPRNGRTVQDDIDTGRQQLSDLTQSLNQMTQAVIAPTAAAQPVNILVADPVTNL